MPWVPDFACGVAMGVWVGLPQPLEAGPKLLVEDRYLAVGLSCSARVSDQRRRQTPSHCAQEPVLGTARAMMSSKGPVTDSNRSRVSSNTSARE